VTALVLDCDGVLADTERHGHLPAFNAAFREHGLPVCWDEQWFGRRLAIGGGKVPSSRHLPRSPSRSSSRGSQ